MKEDFSELIEYLDKKFDQTATKQEVRELRTEIVVIKEDVKELKADFSELKETVHELVTGIDRLAKAIDDLRVEYSAIAMQMNRHEKWIQQLAQKLGMKLDYD
jgi:chromosome segregation ATPase